MTAVPPGAQAMPWPAQGDPLAGLPATELAQFVYSSSALCPEQSPEMAHIRDVALSRNARLGLTGFLHREEDMFFQCLEGPSEALREIKALLNSDPRHRDMKMLVAGPIAQRRFEGWAMGYSSRRTLSLFEWITASSGPDRSRRVSNGQDVIDFLMTVAARTRQARRSRPGGR